MSLLKSLLERHSAPVPVPECPHTALAPRWDNAEDMGKHDRISAYLCTSCSRTLTVAEAQRPISEKANKTFGY